MSNLSKEIKALYIDIGALTFFYALNVVRHGKTEEEQREYQRKLTQLVEHGVNLWKKQKQKG